MALNIKEEVIKEVKASKYYYFQLDVSTDISNMAHLLTFVRFEDEKSVKGQLLFCKPLLSPTTSNDTRESLCTSVVWNGKNLSEKYIMAT
jgi:hypothetical protein